MSSETRKSAYSLLSLEDAISFCLTQASSLGKKNLLFYSIKVFSPLVFSPGYTSSTDMAFGNPLALSVSPFKSYQFQGLSFHTTLRSSESSWTFTLFLKLSRKDREFTHTMITARALQTLESTLYAKNSVPRENFLTFLIRKVFEIGLGKVASSGYLLETTREHFLCLWFCAFWVYTHKWGFALLSNFENFIEAYK